MRDVKPLHKAGAVFPHTSAPLSVHPLTCIPADLVTPAQDLDSDKHRTKSHEQNMI